MVSGIIPIWVTYYARDIMKMEHANVLNSFDEKYHVYDHEYGAYLQDDQERKKTWDFLCTYYWNSFCIATHYMAIHYVEDEGSASFYPPYIEKRVVYPELYKRDETNGWKFKE